jgi:hypothetical protein
MTIHVETVMPGPLVLSHYSLLNIRINYLDKLNSFIVQLASYFGGTGSLAG